MYTKEVDLPSDLTTQAPNASVRNHTSCVKTQRNVAYHRPVCVVAL